MKYKILISCFLLLSTHVFAQDIKNMDVLNFVMDSILFQKEESAPVILEKESMILDTTFCGNWDNSKHIYSKFGKDYKEFSNNTSNILDLSKYITCKTNLLITSKFSKNNLANRQMDGYFRFLKISTPLFSTDGNLCLIKISGDGEFLFLLERINSKWNKKMLLKATVW